MNQLRSAFESNIDKHIPFMFEDSVHKEIERQIMIRKMEKLQKQENILISFFAIFAFIAIVTGYFFFAKNTAIDLTYLQFVICFIILFLSNSISFKNKQSHA